MKIYTFRVIGTHPLLMHNPESMASPKEGLALKRILPREEEAKLGRYVDNNGNFYFPAQAFKSCLVAGAKGRRIGKQAATAILKGTVFCAEDRVTLLDAKTMKPMKADRYEIDVRRAVVQNSGVHRARPKVTDWACRLALEVDDQVFADSKSIGIIKEALSNGGRMVGVGDFRPEKGGPFGRFTVEGE